MHQILNKIIRFSLWPLLTGHQQWSLTFDFIFYFFLQSVNKDTVTNTTRLWKCFIVGIQSFSHCTYLGQPEGVLAVRVFLLGHNEHDSCTLVHQNDRTDTDPIRGSIHGCRWTPVRLWCETSRTSGRPNYRVYNTFERNRLPKFAG